MRKKRSIFSLSGGLIGSGVDERDAELGAHERELLGAVVGAVVDEQSHGESPADDGVLEHGQETSHPETTRQGLAAHRSAQGEQPRRRPALRC